MAKRRPSVSSLSRGDDDVVVEKYDRIAQLTVVTPQYDLNRIPADAIYVERSNRALRVGLQASRWTAMPGLLLMRFARL